ncbi:unnamed protein product [Trichogramma brassicae]|uniref:Retrotransposon gag domain-containing protein n=1 Tax=Trichogramma brassicae TaxID=86971 RepID=A0A6H5IK71_9HYME|nr:unnamed protein product [Trichogramma brassicae]
MASTHQSRTTPQSDSTINNNNTSCTIQAVSPNINTSEYSVPKKSRSKAIWRMTCLIFCCCQKDGGHSRNSFRHNVRRQKMTSEWENLDVSVVAAELEGLRRQIEEMKRQQSTNEGKPRDNRDIGELVRRWKIQFDGFGQMSVESFIERVEECGFLAGLTDRDLLLGLSETLTGTAAKWYRSNRYSFRTWDDFCKAARRMFGIDRYGHQQLLEQIKKRTQGPDERVAEYIICIQSVSQTSSGQS